MPLIDSYQRNINYLRLSVTDHCNYRCHYCRPEDDKTHSQRLEILSYEEMARIVDVFAELGVTKVRLTGGEPLLRKDIIKLVKLIKKNPYISDIPLSTNAHLLANMAFKLKSAGVNRVNISLDSLQEKCFFDITRGGDLTTVLYGIDMAIKSGMTPIKLNMVVMKGVNDDEIESMIDYAIKKQIDIRFIETMPIGSSGVDSLSQHYSLADIMARVDAHLPHRLQSVNAQTTDGPANNFKIKNSHSQVGVISAISNHFCATCNRVRLTAKGDLILCLGQENKLPLKSLLRQGADDKTIKEAIIGAIAHKPEKHYFNENKHHIELRNMVQMGG